MDILSEFADQVRVRPESPALVEGDRQLTYAELDQLSGWAAARLAERGVGPETVVAVRLPCGVSLVVAELAILRAGAAFLPIDPANPPDRAAYMVTMAGALGVVTSTETDSGFDGAAPSIHLDELTAPGRFSPISEGDRDGDRLAYVIFTSGSTGRPKGVLVGHRGLANLAYWHRVEYGLTGEDRVSAVASPGFDFSVWEIWPALAAGATVLFPDSKTVASPTEFPAWLADQEVTVCLLPTALGTGLLRAAWPVSTRLRHFVLAGEKLTSRPPAGLPFTVHNAYGPTEVTAIATAGVVEPAGPGVTGLPPIGRPILGTAAHILDSGLHPVAPGQVGEIYLGGIGVGRGYAGRGDLTAEHFVPDPFATTPGARLYRTGDLARYLPDGQIEYLERRDDQIKIDGYSVEPGEITAALVEQPDVTAAHVLPHPNNSGGLALVAYVVPADPRRLPAASALRRRLRELLPSYLVPRMFVIMEKLPLTVNGKVDHSALPDPDLHRPPATSEGTPPRSPLERELVEIWRDVLCLPALGIEDSFFELGGNSLLANQILARINNVLEVEVPAREIFANPTVAGLATVIERLRADGPGIALPAVTPGRGGSCPPLSQPQEQVWFLNKLAPGNSAYHAQTTIRVVGAFNADIFERTLTEMVRRHDSLRTIFDERQGRPVQLVHPPEPYRLARHDLIELAQAERERRLADLIRAELETPFALDRLPLARWSCVRLAADEHELILVEHHLVHDGWSFSVLMGEIEAIYNAFAEGRDSPLSALPVQFGDYAAWQRDVLESGALDGQLDYWKRQLAGVPETLALPTDRPRPARQRFHGNVLRVELPAGLPSRLRKYSRDAGVSIFMTMYAAFTALLNRYSGATDIAVGSGFANRRLRETEGLIGMLVNTVVLRNQVTARESFNDLAAKSRDTVLDAAANQEYPFQAVVESLGVRRDPSRNPLVQIFFSAHDSEVRNPQLGASVCTVFERGNGSAKTDLNIIVVPRSRRTLGEREHTDDRITLLWEYNTDLFDAETMRGMIGSYFRLLEHAISEPERVIADLNLMDEADIRLQLTAGDPAVSSREARATNVFADVIRNARNAPDSHALEDGDSRLTYGELAALSGRAATRLCERGAGPERVIAVCLPRGIDLVVAELAVARTGAAFLPIDPANPVERVRYMVEQAGVSGVIGAYQPRAADVAMPVWSLDELIAPSDAESPPEVEIGADALAYLIFTSGSTGRPKGVMLTHRGLANLVVAHKAEYDLTARDRVTAVASPGFDFSVWEIWPALAAGATIMFPARETLLSPAALASWLTDHQSTVCLLPTALGTGLLHHPVRPASRLRHLGVGGEQLTTRPASGLPFRVHNAYGPTEITVAATSATVEPAASGDDRPPPIGRPLTGVRTYLLDAELNLVPPGVPGEMYIGGPGVGRGYVSQPGLTAERFVPNPFAAAPGERLYRTGDLGRRRPDGQIEYLGRIDDQVKLRGFRIETGEVSAVLARNPRVAQAYVAVRPGPGGQAALVAYVVPTGPAPSAAELRAHAAVDLPGYMIPAVFHLLDELPLTRSGKIDTDRLPTSTEAPGHEYTPAVGDLETRIAGIWGEALRLDKIGRDANFFDLGGHSLLLAQVHDQLVRQLGRSDLALVELFEYPTVCALAARLAANRPAPTEPPTTETRPDRRRVWVRRQRARARSLGETVTSEPDGTVPAAEREMDHHG